MNERYFRMSKEDGLKVISQCSTIIGILEKKWPRPQSTFEAAVLQTLLNIRETVRRAYEIESPGEA